MSELLKQYCETRRKELKQAHNNHPVIVGSWQTDEIFQWGVIEGQMLMLDEIMNRLKIPYIPFNEMQIKEKEQSK